MANGRTKREFKNPRMNPKVVSQAIEYAKEAHVINTGSPDDEGFFEIIENHTKNAPKNVIHNHKNGYKEFESLMNDLQNGGDVSDIKNRINNNFRGNTQKYLDKYINESLDNGVYEQYKKDLDVIKNGSVSDDGYYEAVDRVNKNNNRKFNILDIEKDANGNINVNKLIDDIANENYSEVIDSRKDLNKNQQKEISETKRKRIEEQERRRKIKDEFKKNGNPNAQESSHRKKQDDLRKKRESIIAKKNAIEQEKKDRSRAEIEAREKRKRERNKKGVDDYYKKKKFVKNSLDLEEIKERKDLINRIMNGEMTEADYLEQTRLEELSNKANDKTISKKERKKARKELAKEINNPLYNKNLNKEWQEKEVTKINSNIESKNKDVIENYLDNKYDINKNIDDYNQFNKDLDLAGGDYLDIDGNELSARHKSFNTKTRKIGLKIKGFISGDFSDYNEYSEAVERLENIGNREFKFYETDNLFNSNGHLNNDSDLDNLNPARTTSAKDAFDDWQTGRKNARARARSAAGSGSTSRGIAAAEEAVLRSAPNAKKLFTAQGAFGVGLNLFNTVATYKEERKEGKGIISSGLRAGADFALGEILGMKYMGLMAAQAAPRAIVKGVEGLGKLTREKNNMQRHEAFGYASFQDTQQLATMRQSGMEMAKMANYNLQQTLMGNEAKYMHR